MVSVPCPLRQCDEVHEVRLDRSGNPFVACKTWRNSVWFRGVGESYLNANNGGGRAIENPSEEPISARPLTVQEEHAARAGFGRDDPLVCGLCKAEVQLGDVQCQNGHPLDWPDQENPDDQRKRVERGILGRHQGRVSDVQRVFEKMRREVEGE